MFGCVVSCVVYEYWSILSVRICMFGCVILSPFLIGQTVSSPNILRTVRRTIIRFLTELRRAFSSPNMVWTVRQTIFHFLTGL